MELIFRPIDQWPGKPTKFSSRSRFKASYSHTLQLLDREINKLGATQAILMLYLDESQINTYGRPYANAIPRRPGVILLVETKKRGTLRFPCDKFSHWHENLRAIALSLEALRQVDRYGVTTSGEQYTGWKQLPSPSASNGVFTSRDEAQRFLSRLVTIVPPFDWFNASAVDGVIRKAEKLTHPDAGGSPDDFKKVQAAKKLLTT